MDADKQLGSPRVLYTLNLNYPREVTDITYPLMRRYAEKIDADFYVMDDWRFKGWPDCYQKLNIYYLIPEQKRQFALFLDSDALVHPEAFFLGDFLPRDMVMHNGCDIVGQRWRTDRYFRRDGRNISSCDWMTAAWEDCIDLWHPLEDLMLDQALANIFPTPFEAAPINWETDAAGRFVRYAGQPRRVPKIGISREHLLDDYVLSRNIAKYGLHFTTLIDILAKMNRPSAQFFWHSYTIPINEKVRLMRQELRRWGMVLPQHYDIGRAMGISGWMNPDELVWLAEQASEHKSICEIGSWMGRSTRVLADNCPGLVYAVDTFKGSDEDLHRQLLNGKPADWLFLQFRNNVGDLLLPDGVSRNGDLRNIHSVRSESVVAAKTLSHMKFDMIFIDGDHHFESVLRDIRAWRPLLAPGGLLCGHDIERTGVQAAVELEFPGHWHTEAGLIWVADLSLSG